MTQFMRRTMQNTHHTSLLRGYPINHVLPHRQEGRDQRKALLVIRNSDLTRSQNITICKDFLHTQSGAELLTESLLSEEIESTVIDRHLIITPLNQLDGSGDTKDFLNISTNIQRWLRVGFSAHAFRVRL